MSEMMEVDTDQGLRDEFATFITRLMDDPYEYEPNDPWVQGMASACVAICRKGKQPNQAPGPLARLASPELIEAALHNAVQSHLGWRRFRDEHAQILVEWERYWEVMGGPNTKIGKERHATEKKRVCDAEMQLELLEKRFPGIAALAEAAARQEVT